MWFVASLVLVFCCDMDFSTSTFTIVNLSILYYLDFYKILSLALVHISRSTYLYIYLTFSMNILVCGGQFLNICLLVFYSTCGINFLMIIISVLSCTLINILLILPNYWCFYIFHHWIIYWLRSESTFILSENFYWLLSENLMLH
jgi:hypothetical protein